MNFSAKLRLYFHICKSFLEKLLKNHLIIYSRTSRIASLLFFNLTFIALGNSYIPTEELLDKEENIQQYGGRKGKKLYNNYLRSAETLSKTVLTNGVWIWAIRIVM